MKIQIQEHRFEINAEEAGEFADLLLSIFMDRMDNVGSNPTAQTLRELANLKTVQEELLRSSFKAMTEKPLEIRVRADKNGQLIRPWRVADTELYLLQEHGIDLTVGPTVDLTELGIYQIEVDYKGLKTSMKIWLVPE